MYVWTSKDNSMSMLGTVPGKYWQMRRPQGFSQGLARAQGKLKSLSV